MTGSTILLCLMLSGAPAAGASEVETAADPSAAILKARALNNSAALFHQKAHYKRAETLFVEAIRALSALGDSAEGDLAAAHANLAEVHRTQRQFDLAEGHYTRALELKRKRHGGQHASVANTLNMIGCMRTDQGRFDDAEKLTRDAIAMRTATGEVDDLHYASMLHNLGEIYRRTGQMERVESLLRSSLELRERLAPGSRDAAASMNSLGAFYQRTHRLDEAEVMLTRALATTRRAVGERHPSAAFALNNLAVLAIERGEAAKGLDHAAEAARIFEERLGADHFYVALALLNVAQANVRMRDYHRAEPMFRRSLAILEHSPDGGAHTADALTEFAHMFIAQSKYSGAEKLLRRAIALREMQSPATGFEATAARRSLANVFRLQKRFTEAQKLDRR